MPAPPFTIKPATSPDGEREQFEGPHHDRNRMPTRPLVTPGGGDRAADEADRKRWDEPYKPPPAEPTLEEQFPDPLRTPPPDHKPYR